MELNQIKKLLYKEKPIAERWSTEVMGMSKQVLSYYYLANISIGEVKFQVPVEEMGDVEFKQYEPAQLLIRWIIL